MKLGTKSVLFGAHQFLIHPFFVALAWWKLYGCNRVVIGKVTVWRELTMGIASGKVTLPVVTSLWHWKLWLVFFVHDLGYWGKPNMDGPEGETHPLWGAGVMLRLGGEELWAWHDLVLYHSRFYAKQQGRSTSALCCPDKLATILTPRWLYLALVRATGEVEEYMAKSQSRNDTGGKYVGMNLDTENVRAWHASMTAYMRRYVEEHKDGRVDTWTPNTTAR